MRVCASGRHKEALTRLSSAAEGTAAATVAPQRERERGLIRRTPAAAMGEQRQTWSVGSSACRRADRTADIDEDQHGFNTQTNML